MTTATGSPARFSAAIASIAPSMNWTRSTELTYPLSTMIVPSRSRRTPRPAPLFAHVHVSVFW